MIPGHGEVTDKQALATYRDMLVTVTERVEKMIAEGKSLEEIIEARPGGEYDADWSSSFITPKKFASSIYYSLVEPK